MTLSELVTGYAQNGGALTGDTLRSGARRAWALLLGQTRKRALDTPAESDAGRLLQLCFDALVDTFAAEEKTPLRSETLGQWSRTYQDTADSRRADVALLLRQYLGETGLLYRGWPE